MIELALTFEYTLTMAPSDKQPKLDGSGYVYSYDTGPVIKALEEGREAIGSLLTRERILQGDAAQWVLAALNRLVSAIARANREIDVALSRQGYDPKEIYEWCKMPGRLKESAARTPK
jgi:hypothetical protein